MKIKDYIKDRIYLILLYLLTIIFTGSVIYMEESGPLMESTGMYVMEVSLCLFVCYLIFDFFVRRKQGERLKKLLQLDHMDWINSLPEPLDSEQKLYHELLKKLYQEYNQRLQDLIGKSREDLDFMTMWVHEIKTPIAASKLIIENSLDKPTEKVLYSLDDELDKIEDFVQMSLFYARSNDFALDYSISRFQLEKVVNASIKREFSGISSKRIHLSIENLDYMIESDEKWLGFIIKQILDNAVKYSKTESTIQIYAQENDKEIILFIKDEGTGIKKEDLGRIFDKNFTGFNGRKQYAATGIGLYLAKKLATKLGHFITVSSEYKKGTTVAMHFAKADSHFIW